MLEAANNLENPELGTRTGTVLAENYILNGMTSWKNRRRNISVCSRAMKSRLMHAYFVKCTGFEKDENGNVTVVHCTYDPETKSGSGFTGRKGKRNHSLGSCTGSGKSRGALI